MRVIPSGSEESGRMGAHRSYEARPPRFLAIFAARNDVFRVLLVAILLLAPTIASACPVCFGDPNAPMQKAVNNGIWVLLGAIAFVQVGLVALFWSFWRRAKALQRRRESLRVIEGGAH